MAYMRIKVKLIIVAVVFFKDINVTNSESCDSQTSCVSCTNMNSFKPPWMVKCKWCPLDRRCHNFLGIMNFFNPCYGLESVEILQNTRCNKDESNSATYDPEKAVLFAKLSALAYAEPENLHNCLRNITPDDDFEIQEAIGRKCEVFSIGFDYKECFAYTAISIKRNMIVLSFRGTSDSSQLKDQAFSTGLTPLTTKARIHFYFWYAFTRLYKPCILNSLKSLIEMPRYTGFHVIVTGHSLGGAMASLAAFALVKDLGLSNQRVSLYTFGMPRVGNKYYAYEHAQVIPNSWRIVKMSDVVPQLPFTKLGYFHHGTAIYYNNNMTDARRYIVCTFSEDPKCSGGLSQEEHYEYFNINMGGFCQALTQGRIWRSFQFDKNHCNVISLKDEIEIANAETISAQSSNCTFEKDFCNWTRAPNSSFNFLRSKGQTDKETMTGPTCDRHGSSTGYFIFADASNNERHTARLRSPNFPAGQYCFEFYYHMYGIYFYSGTLKVDMYTSKTKMQNLFETSFSLGSKWNHFKANVSAYALETGEFHFVFEARIGTYYTSDIALDDIIITKGLCSK